MTNDICDIVKWYLNDLAFVDKITGLVRPITYTSVDAENNPIKKTIPVSYKATHAECLSGRIEDFIPDSKYKSVMYFEEISAPRLLNQQQVDYTFQVQIRLVCWLNITKLGLTDGNISALVLTNILDAITTKYINSGIYKKIRIVPTGEVLKNNSIFVPKYTYDETQLQYLFYPFDYFALDFTVTYSFAKNCKVNWQKNDPIECENHENK